MDLGVVLLRVEYVCSDLTTGLIQWKRCISRVFGVYLWEFRLAGQMSISALSVDFLS